MTLLFDFHLPTQNLGGFFQKKQVDLKGEIPQQTLNFSKEEIKDPSRNEGSQKVQVHQTDSNPRLHDLILVQRGTTESALAAAESTANLCFLRTIT